MASLTGFYDMQCLQINKRSQGFTLVEMLVVAPFIILLIGVVIVFVVNLTGDGLKTREKNSQAFDVQNALNSIEDDATFATAFLSQTVEGANAAYTISTPQGSNDDASGYATSANGPLLIAAPATTTNPFDSARQLVYLNEPDATCNSSTLVTNTPYSVLYVYFVRDGTLWRRSIMGALGSYSLCNGPSWQQASCSPADVASGSYSTLCKAEDSELVNDISSFSVQYFTSASSSTPLSSYNWSTANSPIAIKVTINTSKQVAGSAVTFTGSLRVASTNIR